MTSDLIDHWPLFSVWVLVWSKPFYCISWIMAFVDLTVSRYLTLLCVLLVHMTKAWTIRPKFPSHRSSTVLFNNNVQTISLQELTNHEEEGTLLAESIARWLDHEVCSHKKGDRHHRNGRWCSLLKSALTGSSSFLYLTNVHWCVATPLVEKL